MKFPFLNEASSFGIFARYPKPTNHRLSDALSSSFLNCSWDLSLWL